MRKDKKYCTLKYCTLYIVRHGETDWNAKGILQGHSNNDLNDIGRKQTKDLARDLKNIVFDAIFSSDLLRARKTAEIISAEKKITIQVTKLLRERSWGHFEGKFGKDLKEFNRVADNLGEKERFSHKYSPVIESDEELASRFISFIRKIIVSYKSKTVLVITHGGVIKAMLLYLGFLNYKNSSLHIVSNTSYVKLLTNGKEFIIEEAKGIKKMCQN